MSDLLSISLSAAVPLWIDRVRKLPPDERHRRAAAASKVIAAHGDIILYRGTAKREDGTKITTAEAFNTLAEAIAILAFFPGGVTLFGQHWEVES